MQSLPKKSLLPFTEEHEAFRKEFGEFLDREIVPYYMDMEKNHSVGKETFKKFGDAGYGCLWLDKKYGGRELDMLYSIVYGEELSKRGLNGVLTRLSSDTVAPYIYAHGTEAQKEKAQKKTWTHLPLWDKSSKIRPSADWDKPLRIPFYPHWITSTMNIWSTCGIRLVAPSNVNHY